MSGRATSTAVAAVQRLLECERFEPPLCGEGCEWCAHPFCSTHGSDARWTDRGCMVAVRAADAATSAGTSARLLTDAQVDEVLAAARKFAEARVRTAMVSGDSAAYRARIRGDGDAYGELCGVLYGLDRSEAIA